jgi:hypothetical protein
MLLIKYLSFNLSRFCLKKSFHAKCKKPASAFLCVFLFNAWHRIGERLDIEKEKL